MANKAFGSMCRIGCSEAGGSQDLGNSLRNGVIQHIPRASVLVLKDPSAVLVLQDLGLLTCLDRPVAGGGAARARTNVAGFLG